jgi:beta-N-acetylhexosaminidase
VEEVTVPQAKEDSTAHVLQMAQAADVVIHCLYTRNVLPQKEKALAASLSSCGAPVITVALGSPYVFLEIPSEGTHVCLYNHTPSSLDAFAEVCAGLAGPGGRIPVTLPGLFPRGHGITW